MAMTIATSTSETGYRVTLQQISSDKFQVVMTYSDGLIDYTSRPTTEDKARKNYRARCIRHKTERHFSGFKN